MISFAQTSPATLILLVALAVLGFVAIVLAAIFARRRRSRRELVKRVAELDARWMGTKMAPARTT